MPVPEAFGIMLAQAGTHLDTDCLAALQRGVAVMDQAAAEAVAA
jgi:hypothetical protein